MSTDDPQPNEFRGPTLRSNAQRLGQLSGAPSRSDLGAGRWQQSTRLYDALNYPNERTLDWNIWLSIYRREGEIGGIVDKLVADTWQGGAPEAVDNDPTEGDDDNDQTDFEQAVETLFSDGGGDDLDLRAPLLDRLIAADILATLGRYSVLVFGFKDDSSVSEPAPEGTLDGFADLAFVDVFSEDDVRFDKDDSLDSDRYGRPETYDIDGDEVHHSRVVHVAENTLADPYEGIPFFKNIVNRICDIQKILGASGEGYWRGGYQGIVLSPPEAIRSMGNGRTERVPGQFEDGGAALAQQIEQYTQDFQRVIRANGDVETLGTQVSDPTAHMDEQWAAIAAAKDLSQSVVKGNETGERATTEDNAAYRSKIGGRRNQYASVRLYRAVIDILVRPGVLPEPDGGPGNYDVSWSPLSEKTDKEKADIQNTKASALSNATAGQPTTALTLPEIRKEILDLDPERGSEAPEPEGQQDDVDPRAIMERMGLTNGNGNGESPQGTSQGTEAAMGSVDEPSGFANPTERLTTVNARADGGDDGAVAEDGGTLPESDESADE